MLLCFASYQGFAQESTKDIVYLKDGTILRGQILEFDPKSDLKIQIEGGSVVVYKSSTILKIQKEKTEAIFDKEKGKRALNIPKEKGWYHSFSGGNVIPAPLVGLRFTPSDLLGFKFEYSTGYKFHRLFGAGLNIGFMAATGDATIPICANFRGYFMKTSASLFYDLNIGYGISLNALSAFQGADNYGGLHVHPAIGIRFPSKRKGHATLDIGYVVQLERYLGFDLNGIDIHSPLFAVTLRVGATF